MKKFTQSQKYNISCIICSLCVLLYSALIFFYLTSHLTEIDRAIILIPTGISLLLSFIAFIISIAHFYHDIHQK